jgi:hypothetical protein
MLQVCSFWGEGGRGKTTDIKLSPRWSAFGTGKLLKFLVNLNAAFELPLVLLTSRRLVSILPISKATSADAAILYGSMPSGFSTSKWSASSIRRDLREIRSEKVPLAALGCKLSGGEGSRFNVAS